MLLNLFWRIQFYIGKSIKYFLNNHEIAHHFPDSISWLRNFMYVCQIPFRME